MEFARWEPSYKQILRDFKFRRTEDERSAEVLLQLLKQHQGNLEQIGEPELQNLMANKSVYVFGEGPDLKEILHGFGRKGTLISADGSTSALMEHELVPDIIVTDLDGKVEDQVKAVGQGAIALIHAHGDNIQQLKKWVPRFRGKVMGTTQAKPISGLYNFGGFTDGDRAAFLADHFDAKKIYLVAFDFLEVGDHTDAKARELKLRKLTWANLLIGLLNNPDIHFYPSSDHADESFVQPD